MTSSCVTVDDTIAVSLSISGAAAVTTTDSDTAPSSNWASMRGDSPASNPIPVRT